ncbi:MAG: helix-turn-helix transcriptional regulator [Rhodospirillales bacterium]|nr:helix-turn-helix transcriptional regulator [Rhodospirillales bacterium]
MREFLAVGDFTLGRFMRTVRERKGMSRVKLAEFAGINKNTMAKYELAGEDGGKHPPIHKLVKICEILEIDPRNVFDCILNETISPEPRKFRFSSHFRTGDDWLYWKLSIKNIDDLNNELDHIAHALYSIESRLPPITESGPGQEGSDRPHVNHDTGAAPTAPDHPQDKEE